MPRPSGARRDVILERAVKVTPFSGKPFYINESRHRREEADNMCKMMAASSY